MVRNPKQIRPSFIVYCSSESCVASRKYEKLRESVGVSEVYGSTEKKSTREDCFD